MIVGNIEIENREEELKFLRVEIRDLQRQIETLRKSIPKAKQLEQELVELQREVSETHEKLRGLERKAEKPSENPTRLVEVGSFPIDSFDQLQAKSLKLEEQLVVKETLVMEREILLEHVERLKDKATVSPPAVSYSTRPKVFEQIEMCATSGS